MPIVSPTDLEIDGWDVSNANLYEACVRARVLDPELLDKLREHLEQKVPMRGIVNSEFIAEN